MGEDITEKEAQEILRQFTESKQSVHQFLNNVAKAEDTTKVGFLSAEELGLPKIPVRTYKELELFCRDVADSGKFADYFKKMAEVQTSTSLSKEGFLIKSAITTHKTLADVSPKKRDKRGLFEPKEKESTTQQPIV